MRSLQRRKDDDGVIPAGAATASARLDRSLWSLVVLDALVSAITYLAMPFTFGTDGHRYLLALTQSLDPEKYGRVADYFRPLFIWFLQAMLALDPHGYLALKLFQHAVFFAMPILLYLALRSADRKVALAVGVLTAIDLNARVYASFYGTEALFVLIIVILFILSLSAVSRGGYVRSAAVGLALSAAMLTREAAAFIFVPVFAYLGVRSRWKWALTALVVALLATHFAQGLYTAHVRPSPSSSRVFAFTAASYGRLVSVENGPATRQLVDYVVSEYYREPLTAAQKASFERDLAANGWYSRDVIFAVGYFDSSAKIDSLFTQAAVESFKAHPVRFMWTMCYRWLTFFKFKTVGQDDMYPAYFESARPVAVDGWLAESERVKYRAEAKPEYAASVWSPAFRWPLPSSSEQFLHDDRGLRWMLRALGAFDRIFAAAINVSIIAMLLSSPWVMRRTRLPGSLADRVWLSLALVAYVSVSILTIGGLDRYRAPVDFAFFTLLATFYLVLVPAALVNRKLRY